MTVRSESLAAGFATGDYDTRTAESDRRLSFDERAPNMAFKLGLRFREDLVFVHFARVASAREHSNPPRNIFTKREPGRKPKQARLPRATVQNGPQNQKESNTAFGHQVAHGW